jgi:large repetitive protein
MGQPMRQLYPITDSITGESEGIIKICAIGKDSTGNWKAEADATTITWTKDTIAPSISAISDLGTINTATNVASSVTDVSTISYSWVETSVNSGTVIISSPTSSASDFSADENDTYTVELTATDAAGNTSTEDFTYTWDTSWPTAVISSSPSGENSTTTLGIDIGGTDVTKYKFKIISGTAASDCGTDSTGFSGEIAEGTNITNDITSSPSIAEGGVVVCVVASDNLDNWQPYGDRSTVLWTKDTVSPVVDAGSAKVVNTSTLQDATVTETNTINTYLWSKDSGPGSANFSSTSIEDPTVNPDEGVYVLRLTVTDAAGNSGDDTVSFEMDITPPTAGATGQLTGTTATSTTTTTTVTGTDVQNYRYDHVDNTGDCTDNSGYSASTPVGTVISAEDLSGLSDGTMTLCLVGEDSAGNWQLFSAPTQITWVMDTTAPSVGTLSAFSSISDSSITVNWSKSTDVIIPTRRCY